MSDKQKGSSHIAEIGRWDVGLKLLVGVRGVKISMATIQTFSACFG